MTKRRKLSARQVQALIKLAGGNRALARLAGVSPGSVSRWRHQGVSAEYGRKLQTAVLGERQSLRELQEERIQELEERLSHAEQRNVTLEQAIESMRASYAPVVTFEAIIQVFRDMARPPDLDEAMGLADDFDMTVREVYDAYYEESE